MIKNVFTLLLLFFVSTCAAQTGQDNIYKQRVAQTVSSMSRSAQDSLHYSVYGNIFDSTGTVGLQRVHIVVSVSGLPMDVDTVSTFTDDKGEYRLWIPERLRKHKILYLSIHPIWGYRSLQAVSFRTSQLPYKYVVSPPFQKIERFFGCGGGVKMIQ